MNGGSGATNACGTCAVPMLGLQYNSRNQSCRKQVVAYHHVSPSKRKAPSPGPCFTPVPRADYWVVVTEVGPAPVVVVDPTPPTAVNAPVVALIL